MTPIIVCMHALAKSKENKKIVCKLVIIRKKSKEKKNKNKCFIVNLHRAYMHVFVYKNYKSVTHMCIYVWIWTTNLLTTCYQRKCYWTEINLVSPLTSYRWWILKSSRAGYIVVPEPKSPIFFLKKTKSYGADWPDSHGPNALVALVL